jgi:hypothetical protein
MILLSFLLFLKHLDEDSNTHPEIVKYRKDVVAVKHIGESRRGRPRPETDRKSELPTPVTSQAAY